MKDLIIQWSKDRKIIPNSTTRVQCMKAVSELGELADALITNDTESVCDAIGDIMVCFYNAEELVKTAECYDALDLLNIMLQLFIEMHMAVLSPNTTPNMLAQIADSQGLTLEMCIEHAYNIIKDRKGELLPNGVFVKEEMEL